MCFIGVMVQGGKGHKGQNGASVTSTAWGGTLGVGRTGGKREQ